MTVRDSAAAAFLRDRGIPFRPEADLVACATAVRDGEAASFVYDAPMLRWLARNEFAGDLSVLPERHERQDYAIGLPLDSPLRKAINGALLEVVTDPAWNDVLERHLGGS